MPSVPSRSATDADVPALIALWEACGLTRPHNHPPTDIAFARKGPNSDVLVIEIDKRLVASAMVGHDGHRGWVYYVAVEPTQQKRGLGRHMMVEAERWLASKGVWKMHLMVRRSNVEVHDFYEKLGFSESEVSVLSKILVAQA